MDPAFGSMFRAREGERRCTYAQYLTARMVRLKEFGETNAAVMEHGHHVTKLVTSGFYIVGHRSDINQALYTRQGLVKGCSTIIHCMGGMATPNRMYPGIWCSPAMQKIKQHGKSMEPRPKSGSP
jgi:hypothetical protein